MAQGRLAVWMKFVLIAHVVGVGCHQRYGEVSWLESEPHAVHTASGWHVLQAVVATSPSEFGPCFYADRDPGRLGSKLELDSIRLFSLYDSSIESALIGRFTVTRIRESQSGENLLCQAINHSNPTFQNLCTHEYAAEWFITPHARDTVLMKSYCRIGTQTVTHEDSTIILRSLVAIPTIDETRQSWFGQIMGGRTGPGLMDDPLETQDTSTILPHTPSPDRPR